MAIYNIVLKTKPSKFYNITDRVESIVKKSKVEYIMLLNNAMHSSEVKYS